MHEKRKNSAISGMKSRLNTDTRKKERERKRGEGRETEERFREEEREGEKEFREIFHFAAISTVMSNRLQAR